MQEERNPSIGLFQIFWRIAVLALPWQTRWFSDATLAGWPWEQGRWSVYGSWIFLLLVIFFGFFSRPPSHARRPRKKAWIVAAGCLGCTMLLALFFNPDWQMRAPAIAQWWIQVALLAAFGWTLFRAQISSREIAMWFVISLLPHVALGFWQYAVQRVDAMKWFGIAAQDPQALGVSVVEVGLVRTLRAYGGFPHPNIFGGWLAVGLIAALSLARDAATKARALGWIFTTSAIAIALVVSFSRGAWIAAAIGVIVLAKRSLRSQFFLIALTCALLATGIVAMSQRSLIFSRTHSVERLERKSLDARWQSIQDGWKLFMTHPLIGTGPNAELFEFVRSAPFESPHNSYLLALVNFGIVGLLLLGMVLWNFFQWAIVSRGDHTSLGYHKGRPYAIAAISCLAMLAFFDHYVWSFWSGQSLVLLAALLSFGGLDNRSTLWQGRPDIV